MAKGDLRTCKRLWIVAAADGHEAETLREALLYDTVLGHRAP
jgi:hypothetical protein